MSLEIWISIISREACSREIGKCGKCGAMMLAKDISFYWRSVAEKNGLIFSNEEIKNQVKYKEND